MKEVSSSLPVLAAALLHDVLEDTPVKQKKLHRFLLTLMSEGDAQQTTFLVDEPEFAGLFLCECRMLLRRMLNGNKDLYERTLEIVDDCLKQVPRKFRSIK